ncbi:MAG: hypothetical protein AAF870_07380, partial [Pseudomonadota bacterium]
MSTMSEQATKNHDKTIVERRVVHAGAKSRQAVKHLRSGMGGRFSGRTKRSSGFEADLLSRHARVQKSTLALALMVLVMVCGVGQFLLAKSILGIWLAVGIGLALIGYRLATAYLQSDPEEQIANSWERNFIALRVMTGLHWAALFIMLPTRSS